MVVLVIGDLDLHTTPHLRTVVNRHLDDSTVELVVLDLSQVEYLGSHGLGVLAEITTLAPRTHDHRTGDADDSVDARGTPASVRLVVPPTHLPVIRPWTVMNLQRLLPLYPSVLDALDPR